MRGLNPSSYTVFLALVVLVVLAGAILVYRLRREVEEDSCPTSDDELLRDFERAYYAGEMDEAEFRIVTATLKAKKAGIPRPPIVPPAAPPADRPLGEESREDSAEPETQDDPARAE